MPNYIDLNGLRTFKNELNYTASDTSIIISNYKAAVNISADSDNMLANTANGLYVDGSGKTDKVSSAVENNFAVFDSDGGIFDSGYKVADDSDVLAILDENLPLTPLQIVFTAPEELTDSDTVLKCMFSLDATTDTITITDFTYETTSRYFELDFTLNDNSNSSIKMPFTATAYSLLLTQGLLFTYYQNGNSGVARQDSIRKVTDYLSPQDIVTYIKAGKFLKLIATYVNAYFESFNNSSNYVLYNVAYDDETNSMILTAINEYVDNIYLRLRSFFGLQNRGAGKISKNVTQVKNGDYLDLVFQKNK